MISKREEGGSGHGVKRERVSGVGTHASTIEAPGRVPRGNAWIVFAVVLVRGAGLDMMSVRGLRGDLV